MARTYYQIWQHDTSGERCLVEFDGRDDTIIAAVGPLHYTDLLAALISNSIEANAELVADLSADDGAYSLVEVADLRNRGEEHLALAFAIRTREWCDAAGIVARYCATATTDRDGADVLQDWMSAGDWSAIGTPESIAAEWDAAFVED